MYPRRWRRRQRNHSEVNDSHCLQVRSDVDNSALRPRLRPPLSNPSRNARWPVARATSSERRARPSTLQTLPTQFARVGHDIGGNSETTPDLRHCSL
jgi:hypothetical protein